MDASTKKTCTETLKLARVTLTEYLLLEGIVLSKTDPEGAIQHINEHVGNMTKLPSDEVIKPSDLNSNIWGFCQKVIRAAPL